MMPKAKGDPYFISCRAGAEEAAQELGVELIWDGPTGLDAAKQNEWSRTGSPARSTSSPSRWRTAPASRRCCARRAQRGIKVLTWDADAEPDARDFFVNQATPEGIGNTLTDEAARLLGGKGEFAIITGALTAANQNEWIAFIKKRMAEKHPGLKLATIRPSDDDRDKAFAETQTILHVHPDVKLVMAISAPAVPGAAEAVRQAGRKDVNVIGLSLPNINKPYVHDGFVQTVVLWNTLVAMTIGSPGPGTGGAGGSGCRCRGVAASSATSAAVHAGRSSLPQHLPMARDTVHPASSERGLCRQANSPRRKPG